MDNCKLRTYKILSAAMALFAANGFYDTGIRQIADAGGVSLGLVNHYFTSKRELGRHALLLIQKFLGACVQPYVDLKTDPVLFDAVTTRVQTMYFLHGTFRKFYLDSLQEGIFFDSMMQYPYQTLDCLRKLYPFPENEDYILLFNRYLPCDIEKTLVLQKEEGHFPNISYDDIPTLICTLALERFVPKEDIARANQESFQISAQILDLIPAQLSEECILSYADELQHAES